MDKFIEGYDIAGVQMVGDTPVLVADEDFIEYLHEMGYEKEIELDELILLLDDWIEEATE